MYLSDLMRGLLRRWYVIVAGLLLTAAGAYAVFQATPIRHEAQSTMMLLPPQETLELEGDNPYLVLGGMGQALAVLTTRLNAPATAEALLGKDGDAEYMVSGDTAAGAPFLNITTQAAGGRDALRLLEQLQDEATDELATMQEELAIPAASVIGIMTVTTASEATAVTTTRMQLTVAALGAGLVLTVALAAAIDGLLAARSRRRAAERAPRPRERGRREPLLARDILGEVTGPVAASARAEAERSRTEAPDRPRPVAPRKRATHAAANASSGH